MGVPRDDLGRRAVRREGVVVSAFDEEEGMVVGCWL